MNRLTLCWIVLLAVVLWVGVSACAYTTGERVDFDTDHELTIRSSPPNARVILNELDHGFTPVETAVRRGSHELTVEKEGYVSWHGEIKISEPLVLNVRLARDTGGHSESSSPDHRSTTPKPSSNGNGELDIQSLPVENGDHQ